MRLVYAILLLSFTGCVEVRSYHVPYNTSPSEVYLDANNNLIMVLENKWSKIGLEKYIGYQGEPTSPRYKTEHTIENSTFEYTQFSDNALKHSDLIGFKRIFFSTDQVFLKKLNQLSYFYKYKEAVNVNSPTVFPARGARSIGYVLVMPSGEYAFFYIKKEKIIYLHEGGFMGWKD